MLKLEITVSSDQTLTYKGPSSEVPAKGTVAVCPAKPLLDAGAIQTIIIDTLRATAAAQGNRRSGARLTEHRNHAGWYRMTGYFIDTWMMAENIERAIAAALAGQNPVNDSGATPKPLDKQ